MKPPRSVSIHRFVDGSAFLIRVDRRPNERARIRKVFAASCSDDYIAGYCDAVGLILVKRPAGGAA